MSAIQLAVDALKLNQAVTSITSLSRIFPLASPQGVTLPHVIVHIASGGDDQLLTGAAKLYRSRIQCDCIAPSATVAEQLGNAVRGALEERKSNYPAKLRDCFVDGVDGSDYSDDRTSFRRYLGFHIHWSA